MSPIAARIDLPAPILLGEGTSKTSDLPTIAREISPRSAWRGPADGDGPGFAAVRDAVGSPWEQSFSLLIGFIGDGASCAPPMGVIESEPMLARSVAHNLLDA
jgi:hypothetical protein